MTCHEIYIQRHYYQINVFSKTKLVITCILDFHQNSWGYICYKVVKSNTYEMMKINNDFSVFVPI